MNAHRRSFFFSKLLLWAARCGLGTVGIILLMVGGVQAQPASDAVPTDIVVRAVSQDAKILHDAVGGARITIREAETGAVLAEGRQTGDSGSTEAIMQQPHARGADIYDAPGAAAFRATLDLAAPTRIEITAEGPLDYPQAMQRTTTTLWVTPGEHLRGNGVVLTLHGFIVEILAPTDPSTVVPGQDVAVRTRIRMMCGCPTEPGGLWDANRYSIQAQLVRDGAVVEAAPLTYAGETSTFRGEVPVPSEGGDQLRVVVSDADRANAGVAIMDLAPSSDGEPPE